MKRMVIGILGLAIGGFVFADADSDYKQGLKVYESNKTEAFELFLKAASGGSIKASVAIGHCYETGVGTTVDYAKAIEFYEMAVKQNSLKACEGLARIYASCSDPAFHDGGKAVKYAVDLVRKTPRDAETLLMLAAAYGRNMEFGEAIRMNIKAGASGGDTEIRKRTEDYRNGMPYPALATDAWLLLAAQKESLWAMSKLADYYDAAGSYEDALGWYEKAVHKGSEVDAFRLAEFYRDGLGGPVDSKKALSYFRMAGEHGHKDAYGQIGYMYFSGKIIRRNMDKAVEYFRRQPTSEDQTFECIKEVLDGDGYRLRLGKNTTEQLRLTADKDNPKPVEGVNDPTSSNYGDEVNAGAMPGCALVFYLAAAEVGDVQSMQAVADLYFKGSKSGKGPLYDVKPDHVRAKYWYTELKRRGEPIPDLKFNIP